MRHGRSSRRSLRESWRLGLLLALLLSASLTACGAERSDGGRAPDSRPSHDPPRSPADDRVSDILTANFALLASSPDGVPPRVRRAMSTRVPGMAWGLAQRISVPATSAYWLVPGAHDLCIVATTPGSPAIGAVCASAGQALRHGIANTSLDPASGRRTIVGVTPKGTGSVLVHSGASTTAVPVDHGRFVLRDSVASPPDQVTLRRPPGAD